MEFPKINYDDFYKFLMSVGVVVILLGILGISYVLLQKEINWVLLTIFCLLIIISYIKIIRFASGKWLINQQYIDRKIAAETKLIERATSLTFKPREGGGEGQRQETKSTAARRKIIKITDRVALISYKVASSLPNSVTFNFLEEFKVWFWIYNHEPKKYLAYIQVKYMVDDLRVESTSDYYGGTKPWNLNPYMGIQAPGLSFPEEIKNAVKQGKRVKLEIRCKVHDEFNNFIEEKLPQTYAYDPENNSWFLEP